MRRVDFLSRALFVCTGLGIGCSASSTSDPAAGVGDGGGTTQCSSSPVSFHDDVIPLFAQSCNASICHGQMGNVAAENLYLGLDASDGGQTSGSNDSAAVYAGLIGVKAIENPSMSLVTAGDLAGSYLWQKLQGDPNAVSTVMSGCAVAANGSTPCSDCIASAPCGAQMPVGVPLDAAAICTIKTWITEGAMND